MPDRPSDRHPRAVLARLAVAALVLAALLAPGGVAAVPRPGESCPDTTPAPGASEVVCGEGTGPDVGGGGTVNLGGLLPVIVGIGIGALSALVAAFIVLRRRSAGPVTPADPGEWWTCRNCGRNNVIGSPRCYACGEWQA
jgi:hypothetical protein